MSIKNDESLKNYNIINYIKIIDLSLLNLLDYSDISDEKFSYFDENINKIVIDLNPNSKKVLEGFIINNINNELYYNRTNIILNTCNPMKNWRQYERKKALKVNKCYVLDQSIYIDELKLNSFINSIFEKLPSRTAILLKKDLMFSKQERIVSSNISISLNDNVKFLEFENVDLYDAELILKHYLNNIGSLLISDLNYIIIRDGNYGYSHTQNISNTVLDDVRLQLLEKGII